MWRPCYNNKASLVYNGKINEAHRMSSLKHDYFGIFN